MIAQVNGHWMDGSFIEDNNIHTEGDNLSEHKLENAIREYSQELSRKNKLGWIPSVMHHLLAENLPHGLVLQLGEYIMKNKGVGKNNL